MSAPAYLDYLAQLPSLAAQNQNSLAPEEFQLARVAGLLAALGELQQAYPSLHVAGTHGKGSLCALCAAALQAHGYRTGLFTSPNLAGDVHGIRIDGVAAAPELLQAAFARLYPYLQAQPGWTYFEVSVALMFTAFALAAVDVAVIEVGLGGRLDATNVLRPRVSVITPIDLDHTAILGGSLAEIAAHKAGIIKPGVPVVSAAQPAEAAAVIAAQAAALNAPLSRVGVEWQVQPLAAAAGGQTLRVRGAAGDWQPLQIRLLGAHQIGNAATAYAALQTLADTGLPVSLAAIQTGFAAARWPGRFEVHPGQPTVILDGAHSPGAARALRAALDTYFPEVPVVLVLGVSADKDLPGLLAALLPRIQQAYATQAAQPRAMPAAQLAEQLGALGLPARAEPQPAAALAAAKQACPPGGVVLVAGSLFLVEEVGEDLGAEPSTN